MSRKMKEQQFLSSSLSSVVSINLDSSWANKSWDANYLSQSTSERELRARFQKRQMQEKEQKLLRLYESQQQRAFQRVGRGSAGSAASLSSSTSTLAGSVGGGGGKVRQLFEERRSNGWDRSYPLEPVAGGGKARPHQHSLSHTQGLPLAVPKTKVTRGASLDRAFPAQTQPPQPQAPPPKPPARRSKSHARGTDTAVNGDAGDHHPFAQRGNKHQPFLENSHSFRKAPNHGATVEEYNNANNNFRRQHAAARNNKTRSAKADNYDYDDDYDEPDEEINYEALGEDVHANRNANFGVLSDNKRQEELYAKYQVRELGNHDLLTSPPPEFGEDALDDTFIYEKLPNVGGRLRSEEQVNNSDRFKTYNTNKHNREPFQEEINRPTHEMATKVQDTKKVAAVRRETVSPPTRAVKPPVKKTELRGTPTGSKTTPYQSSSTTVAPSKQTPTARPSPPSNMYKSTSHNVSKSPQGYQKSAQNGPAGTTQSSRSAPSRDDLIECDICHRRFTVDRISVHQEICLKTAQKKRKEYDALKHRVQGTEAEQFVRRALRGHQQQKKTLEVRKPDWRRKHEEFIQTIRAAKEMTAHVAAGGKISDLPPPPPLDTSDYIQCPHCGRRFNQAAADRHIPRCANMQHNKPKPPASNRTFNKRR